MQHTGPLISSDQIELKFTFCHLLFDQTDKSSDSKIRLKK